MSVYVFTGPTISASGARRELEAVYLPPAAEGDVYRITLQHPQAIGIIDGYFQSVPAVRHKEILWAMSRGIHVFGSASIGALRAAELFPFGMEGVGTVFELYRDGILEDDDEVAVAHGPAEMGYLACSEAMVNIRQTLQKAERVGIISAELRKALEEIGKELFYPDRNYPMLVRCASECGIPEVQLSRLRQWLPKGRVDQKRKDALAMLRLIRRRLAKGLERKKVAFSFEHTSMWESAWRQAAEDRTNSNAQSSVVINGSILDELRLEGDQYKQHCLMALERFFAIAEAYRMGMTVTSESRREAELEFRRERDLIDAAKFERWMKQSNLSYNDFDALMMDEARVRWIHQVTQPILVTCVAEQLRLSGDYPRLAARAMAKSRLLESFGLKNPYLERADVSENQLLHWYFEELLRQPMPVDSDSYARNLGFATPDAFRRALVKEYLYRHLEHQTKQ